MAPILRLLEPGALFEGALLRQLLGTPAQLLHAGERLGVFRLVRELGHGGMGVVWLAQRDDGEYEQAVAIKCINEQRNDQSNALFRRERQILAELRHPNIARLLDGGRTESGALWFAMELIEGVSIERHAREKALPLVARLGLLLSVIDAISAAHARLVIHRDLKPSNVLVDADGVAKLLDFGIAAVIDDAAPSLAFTPAWASPEQRDMQPVGTASDQYQLGLLLECLLRGNDTAPEPLAPGEAPQPQRWITMSARRQEELSAIIRRACAVAVAERYQSVAELGRDLERVREHRPVSAVARRWGYPLQCAMQRRPGIFLATGAVVALLTVVVGGFTWRLVLERDLSRMQTARAEATKDFLVGLFSDGDPSRGSDPDLSARELIQAGAQRMRADSVLPPDVRQDILQLITEIQLRLGDAENASALLPLLDANTMPPGRLDELNGRLATVQGRPNDAVAAFERAASAEDSAERQLLLGRAESEAGLGELAQARLQALLQDEAALPDALAATAWTALGVLQWRQAQPKQALLSYERALQRAAPAASRFSPVAIDINRGLALNDLGQFDQALAAYLQAESGLLRFPNLRHQGLILQNRGNTQLRQGNAAAAKSSWETLLALVDDGANPGLEASALHNLAASADALGDPIGSIDYSLRAAASRQRLGDEPSALSSQINVIAKLYDVGLASEGVAMAAAAVARANTLDRPDLAARAQLAGSYSECVLAPPRCAALLQDAVATFAEQDNRVKQLEVLTRLAREAFEQADSGALAAAVSDFERAIGATPSDDQRAELATLRALAARDLNPLEALGASSSTALRARVILLLERGASAAAARVMGQLREADSERYWQLRERVAVATGNTNDALNARAKRQSLPLKVRALLAHAADHMPSANSTKQSASPSSGTITVNAPTPR